MILCGMWDLCRISFGIVVDLFRPRAALEAEILVLRQQIIVLRRGKPSRVPFLAVDRMVLGWVCQLFPKTREALAIVRPDTVVRWHRAGFRCYWRWKSRSRLGRPAVPAGIRQLIRQMSVANPLWGAPRIHGELLKLGIDIGQSSIAKYMARGRGPPSQGWRTFLRNHADGIAAMDLFVVPTISFRLLYGLLIMGHGRRQILWFGVTAQPTAEWDCQPTDGGLWLGANPSRSDPRSRCLLRRRIRSSRSLARHSRSSNLTAVTLAERVCGAPDRLDPPGMPGPHRGDRRAAPAPYPQMLHGVLQRGAHASIAEQGCAHREGHPVRRAHRSAARAWWTAPSVRADLICDRDRGTTSRLSAKNYAS